MPCLLRVCNSFAMKVGIYYVSRILQVIVQLSRDRINAEEAQIYIIPTYVLKKNIFMKKLLIYDTTFFFTA